MKKMIAYLMLGLLLPFTVIGAEQKEENVKHEVSGVTVYRDRAMVTRTTQVDLKPGVYTLRYGSIPDELDVQSVRADAPNGIDVRAVTWERVITEDLANEKLVELTRREEANQLAIQKNMIRHAVLNTQQRILSVCQSQLNQAISEQSGTTQGAGLSKKWNPALTFISKHVADNNAQLQSADDEMNALQREQTRLSQERTLYAKPLRTTRLDVCMTLEVKNAYQGPLSISYVTHAASWEPFYSARLLEDNNKIAFEYRGCVRQNTGENWNDVAVKLSTASPQISATPPENPLYTTLTGRAVGSGEDARRIVTLNGGVVSQVSNSAYVADAGAVDAVGGAGMYSAVSGDGPAVTFNIAGKQLLLSGDQPTLLTVTAFETKAVVLAECAPQLRLAGYLKAKFRNSTAYPILSGRVDIYRNSGYIGTANMKYYPVGEEVAFYAGAIDGLGVKFEENSYQARATLTENHDLNTNVTTLYNNTGSDLTLRLRTQVPVSEIEEVKIEIYNKAHLSFDKNLRDAWVATPGYTYEKEKGLLYWDVTLKQGETREIRGTYDIITPVK